MHAITDGKTSTTKPLHHMLPITWNMVKSSLPVSNSTNTELFILFTGQLQDGWKLRATDCRVCWWWRCVIFFFFLLNELNFVPLIVIVHPFQFMLYQLVTYELFQKILVFFFVVSWVLFFLRGGFFYDCHFFLRYFYNYMYRETRWAVN